MRSRGARDSVVDYPTPSQAIEALSKAGCSPQVIEHCKIVSQLAVRLARLAELKGIEVDINLVRVGGLLHDIGRSRTHGVEHGFMGSTIIDSYGYSSAIARITERHVGAGISSSEAQKLGLPKRDFIPETLEEKLVCYADKLIEGRRRVAFDEALDDFAKELGADHPAVERLRNLHLELIRLIGEPQ
jgi:uncharacterized protein